MLFLAPGTAGAQAPVDPSEARERATLVPNEWLPPAVRKIAERDANGRRWIVRQYRLGNLEMYEVDYGDGRVRLTQDGRVLGRD
jgi:hypothetical protein